MGMFKYLHLAYLSTQKLNWCFAPESVDFYFLQTLQFLQQNAKERSESSASATSTTATSYTLPPTTSKMSMLELDELRKKLGNVTASSNAPLVRIVWLRQGDRFISLRRIQSGRQIIFHYSHLFFSAACWSHTKNAEGQTQQEESHAA